MALLAAPESNCNSYKIMATKIRSAAEGTNQSSNFLKRMGTMLDYAGPPFCGDRPMYTCTILYICITLYVNKYIHTYIYICVCARVFVFKYTYIYIYIHLFIYWFIYLCIYIYLFIYSFTTIYYIYLHVYIDIYTCICCVATQVWVKFRKSFFSKRHRPKDLALDQDSAPENLSSDQQQQIPYTVSFTLHMHIRYSMYL